MPRQAAAMFSAVNRRDWALFAGPPYGPVREVRLHSDEQATVGLKARYDGPEPMREMNEDWENSWGRFHIDPLEMVDFGDRWVYVMRYRAGGARSGIRLEETAGCLVVPSGGYNLELFWDAELALASAHASSKL